MADDDKQVMPITNIEFDPITQCIIIGPDPKFNYRTLKVPVMDIVEMGMAAPPLNPDIGVLSYHQRCPQCKSEQLQVLNTYSNPIHFKCRTLGCRFEFWIDSSMPALIFLPTQKPDEFTSIPNSSYLAALDMIERVAG